MPITYYDHREARNRIKPRYVWAFWAYLFGIASGAALLEYLL